MRNFIFILMLLFLPIALYAKEKKPAEKLTIAIMQYSATGCSESLGFAMTDMVSGELFKADYFILLERGRMDIVLRESGLPLPGLEDAQQIATIGKRLAVKKVVSGSIIKLGRGFRIETRVTDVNTGNIDLSLTRKALSESGLEETAYKIARDIERHYRGYGRLTGICDLSLTASALFGFGDLTEGADFGYGCRLNFYINSPFRWPIQIIISPGFFSLVPKLNSIDWMMYMPVELYISYPFRINRNLFLIPSIGGGYLLSWISYDKVEERTTPYIYKTEFFYNPLLSLRLEIDILLIDRWYLAIIPAYTVFFESQRTGHLLDIALGIKVLF